MFSTSPRTGIFIAEAMRTALPTIMDTSSWGEVTLTIPSTGTDWNTVSGTSPVPGGISTNRTSRSPQITSVQNCFTAPAITGPLQITGSSLSGRSRLMDIIWMPDSVTEGNSPSSLPVALVPSSPNIFGMEGPVISASKIPVFFPCLFVRCNQKALRIAVRTVLSAAAAVMCTVLSHFNTPFLPHFSLSIHKNAGTQTSRLCNGISVVNRSEDQCLLLFFPFLFPRLELDDPP